MGILISDLIDALNENNGLLLCVRSHNMLILVESGLSGSKIRSN